MENREAGREIFGVYEDVGGREDENVGRAGKRVKGVVGGRERGKEGRG